MATTVALKAISQEVKTGAVQRALSLIRDTLNLTLKEIAHLISVDQRTVFRWEAGKNPPSRAVWHKLEKLQFLASVTSEALNRDPKRVQEWLHEPSEALGGWSPGHLLREGDLDTLVAHAANYATGATV